VLRPASLLTKREPMRSGNALGGGEELVRPFGIVSRFQSVGSCSSLLTMRFDPSFLEEIRARVPLADLIGRSVKLIRAGRELKGLCPFHNENTPSFTIVEDKGFYHCFGCGAHGSQFDFLMQKDGLSFPEAVERLAGEAGLAMPARDAETAARAKKAASLYDVLEIAATWFQAQLATGRGQAARDYLVRRDVRSSTADHFRLGYAPPGRTDLAQALAARDIAPALAVEAGLLIKPEDGGPPFDRFRNRLIFPICDHRGRVIGFGGRALDAYAKAKYLNSPETPVFHKGRALYNLHRARPAAHAAQAVIAVEGYMDVIALDQAGLAQAVAPLGTALTEEQIQLLWRLAPEPVLCFDGDQAGLRAAARAVDRVLPVLKPGYSLRFALLPEGLDPDDLVRRDGAAAMAGLIEQAIPLVEMLWRLGVQNQSDDTPERRAGLERALMARLEPIPDERLRRLYRSEFGRRLAERYRAASRAGGSAAPRTRLGTRLAMPRPPLAVPGRDQAEKIILLTLLNHPELLSRHDEAIAALSFSTRDRESVKEAILDAFSCHDALDRSALRDHLNGLGCGQAAETLRTSAALKPVWQAQPDAALSDADIGLRHAFALLRRSVLDREIAQLSHLAWQQLGDEGLRRLTALKAERHALDDLDADSKSFGLASNRESGY